MIINVFGKCINPDHIARLHDPEVCPDEVIAYSSSYEPEACDNWKVAVWHDKTVEEVANEINRLVAQPAQTPQEILNKVQTNLISIVRSLVMNKDCFKPEEPFSGAFEKLVSFAEQTLKEAGIKVHNEKAR
jgi:hypothetical protein